MNPSNVNSDPRNCSNLLTTPPYAPTINYNLLLNQKKSARKIDFFSSLLVTYLQ
jgi:hypothetical protein